MGDPAHKLDSLNVQNLIDSIPALIHSSLPDGNLDFFNQGWLKYIGLPLEDISGWKWTSAIHPEDARLSRVRCEAAWIQRPRSPARAQPERQSDSDHLHHRSRRHPDVGRGDEGRSS